LSVIDWSVRSRTVALVLCVAVSVAGLYSYATLPREAFPDVKIPYVFINTRYRGVSPADVESSVTVKIENKLKGLSGVRKIASTSAEGLSQITVEFETGIDIDDAVQKVKDRVEQAKNDLPGDLDDDPEVSEINVSELPIVTVVLSGEVGLARLKEIAEDLKEDLEAIPGVLEAEVSGGVEREIRVEVDPDRVAQYRLSLAQVNMAIPSENLSVSGGSIRTPGGRFQIRVPGEFKTPEEARKIVVAVVNGSPVYLDDLAEIVDGFKDEETRSRLDGRSAVTIYVKKRSGENVVKIVDEVESLLRRRDWPAGVRAAKLMDFSKFVKRLVADLENNLLTGFFLVLAVVLFSMGLRNSILVSVSMPLSMFMTFVTLDAMGITLNMVVLFSTTFAMGMLVDNAIVITENIYRFMQAGVPRLEAARRATKEVAWPILASTATTVAAFAPLLFWKGLLGQVFYYIPVSVISALVSCQVVAFTINPALAAIFMKAPPGAKKLASAEDVLRAGEQPAPDRPGLLRAYRKALRFCLKRRSAVLVGAGLVTVGCVALWLLVAGLETPLQLLPSVDEDNVFIYAKPPEGAGLEYADAIIAELEQRIAGGGAGGLPPDLPDVEHVLARSSARGGARGFFAHVEQGVNSIGVQYVDADRRKSSSRLTTKELRRRIAGVPGAEITLQEQRKGPPTGSPVNIEVSGDDVEVLGEIAEAARRALQAIPFVYDVRDDFVTGAPTIRVRVDRRKAALFGLTTQMVGLALKGAFNGVEVSTFRQGGDDYDITVRFPGTERETANTLERFFIPSPSGELVPLTTIASISCEGGPAAINRIDHRRVVTVRANVDEARLPGPVARRLAGEALSQGKLGKLPPGYSIRFTGQFEFEKEARTFLFKSFMIGLLLIVSILVAVFDSVLQPLVIMTSVILSMGGAFLGLAVCRLPFVIVMSGVGIISLAGVVVNNAIVLVDYTNKLRERGLALDEAVVAAGATRLRPVLLTAVTTIAGLVPILLGVSFDFHTFSLAIGSESTQWWRPMAACVAFGLGVATFLTLFVVPCMYHLVESARERVLQALGRQLARTEPSA